MHSTAHESQISRSKMEIHSTFRLGAFHYQQDKQVGAYLNDAGGATREADPKRVFVISADGSVISHQSRDKHCYDDFAKIRLLPGDAVIVP
jgi:polysaccharide biosynthesis/export protein